jgi:multidrug efflux pump subunit AcrA (membrane-fusion protein)
VKYRFKALDKQRQPDQLDSPMLLASPGGWVAVFVVLIAACFIGLWAFLGSIPRVATVQGVLSYPGGVLPVQAPVPGTLSDLAVDAGDTVTAGQSIGTVRTADGTDVAVRSNRSGRVVAVDGTLGAVLPAGAQIAQVEVGYATNARLQADLLVDAAVMPHVRVGQEVLVSVPGVSSRSFGLLRGRISAVEPFPLTAHEAATVFGRAGTAGPSSSSVVPPTRVQVALAVDPATFSGYGWTSTGGPPVHLTSRTPVSGEIELGDVTPLGMILGG